MVTAAMNSVVGSPPKNPFDLDFELIFKHTQPISLALVSEVFLLVKDAIASAQIEQLEKLDLEAWSIPESARQRAIDYVRANSDYILWLDSVSAGSSRFGLKAKAIGLAFLALVGEKVVEKGVDEIVDSAKTQIVETINRRHAIPHLPRAPSRPMSYQLEYGPRYGRIPQPRRSILFRYRHSLSNQLRSLRKNPFPKPLRGRMTRCASRKLKN
jgi:hypothetical protein